MNFRAEHPTPRASSLHNGTPSKEHVCDCARQEERHSVKKGAYGLHELACPAQSFPLVPKNFGTIRFYSAQQVQQD